MWSASELYVRTGICDELKNIIIIIIIIIVIIIIILYEDSALFGTHSLRVFSPLLRKAPST